MMSLGKWRSCRIVFNGEAHKMKTVVISLVLVVVSLDGHDASAATTPSPTIPTTPPAPVNNFYSTYSSASKRQDKFLKVKAMDVITGVSRIHCLSLCLRKQGKLKSKRCQSFNYGKGNCYLLNTFVCDGDKNLTHAPGYSYYDLVTDHKEDAEFSQSKQCGTTGRCSSKCMKFKLFKTPLSWHEARNACLSDGAILAIPKILKDHETLMAMMKNLNVLQIWFGLNKREGVFYFEDGTVFDDEIFHMWGPGQPNDSGGTQNCVQMMSEMDYMWNDFDCSRPVGYICQYVW